jgi:drug/metabolite transporter (DMT)-like permease
LDHWTSNGWRYGASALFWLPAVIWALWRGTLPKSIWVAAIVPAFCNTVAQVAFTAAYHYVNPGVASFGLRLQMVFVAVGAFILFPPERATIRRPAYIGGMALLFGGIATVLVVGNASFSEASSLGIWLSVGAGIGYAAYALGVRKFMYGYHPIYAFGIIALYTGASLVAAMLVMGKDHGAAALHLEAREWWAMGLSAFLGIALGHVLYYTAIDRLGVATSSAVLQLQPFVVSALSFFYFAEVLTMAQWGGGLLALCGAAFVLRAQRGAEREAALRR